jgi:hypothetical protein
MRGTGCGRQAHDALGQRRPTITIVESLTRARLRWVITIAFGAGALIIPVPDVFVAWIRGLLHR